MQFKNHYRNGELVFCNAGWGIIISIIDVNTGELFFEKEVITGMGDKNTKVKFEVDIIATNKPYNIHFLDPKSEVNILNRPERLMVNSHDIFKIDDESKEFTEKEYNIIQKRMNIRREFLYKYSKTRDDKLNILLE